MAPLQSRYHDVHEPSVLNGPGDARPTALQVVKDEGLEGKLTDKVFLVTGTSSGIGIETARACAATGAKVFCAVRNMEKGEEALKDILEPGRVELLKLDMNSLDSVRAAAADFNSRSDKLNILICNAGIMATPEGTKTADGFEAQFGTCHLAHFLLFQLVKPALLASATPEFGSRVICLSSSGHKTAPPNFDDYNYTKPGTYDPWKAYGQAKTANIYMANEIERLYGSQNLHGLSVHPGGIFTGLQVHVDENIKAFWNKPEVQKAFKSPEQGASTSMYAALSKDWEGKGGRFFEDCEEAGPGNMDGVVNSKSGYAPHAYNEEGEKQLWKDSLKMVGLEEEQ